MHWVFAGLKMKGAQPIWPGVIFKRFTQPAAKRAAITKRIGWHTFRHTHPAELETNGEDVKAVQELRRDLTRWTGRA